MTDPKQSPTTDKQIEIIQKWFRALFAGTYDVSEKDCRVLLGKLEASNAKTE